MKKALLGVAAVAASFAFLVGGTGTALAAAPSSTTTYVCIGAALDNGSFQTQTVGAQSVISEPLCVGINLANLSKSLNNSLAQLLGIHPPKSLPTPEELQALVQKLASEHPSGLLGALVYEQDICNAFHMADSCNTVTGAVLGLALGALPTGSVTLNGTSGYCFQGTQSGTGSAYGGGSNYQFDWTANYGGGGLIGTISGTEQHYDFDSGSYVTGPVSGYIGPNCGAGLKVVVLQAT